MEEVFNTNFNLDLSEAQFQMTVIPHCYSDIGLQVPLKKLIRIQSLKYI